MLAVQSCIVADPPDYREPVRTRPLLDVYQAIPAINNIVVWTDKDTNGLTFTVPVRSEDAGFDLSAHAFLDYGTSQEQRLAIQAVAASTYDQIREVISKWPSPIAAPGCHIFSLVIAHVDTFKQDDQFHLDPVKAGEDAAIINWWVNINPIDNMVNTLKDCPRSGLPTLP